MPRNNPVEKLKVHDMECSPILRKVKDAFGNYFERTMTDGEEDPAKTEGEKQEGAEEHVKKKKSKKARKPEAGFL